MAPSGPTRAVLFDLDGTLIDSAADIVALLNRILLAHGRSPVPPDQGRLMIGRGVRVLLQRGFAATGGECPDMDAAEAEFLRLYEEDAVHHTVLYPGAIDALEALAAQGRALGLVTNKPIGPTRAALRHFGLLDRFAAIYGGDSVAEKKPAPDMLLQALSDLGCSPDCAVMVGDSDNDILAAQAAGVPSIVVTFGYSRVPVASLGADRIADRLDAVPGLVSSLVPA